MPRSRHPARGAAAAPSRGAYAPGRQPFCLRSAYAGRQACPYACVKGACLPPSRKPEGQSAWPARGLRCHSTQAIHSHAHAGAVNTAVPSPAILILDSRRIEFRPKFEGSLGFQLGFELRFQLKPLNHEVHQVMPAFKHQITGQGSHILKKRLASRQHLTQ